MIAIAESGSTKCEWVILDDLGQIKQKIKTQGFNPDFHNKEYVEKTLNACDDFACIKNDISHLYFYGAGCSSAYLNQVIKDGLVQVFRNAAVEVDHDLLASAYSLYHGKPVICCILGTGSNSAYFDGKILKEAVPALGFVLGDEGGGGYFGKRLVADYFYNKLPEAMQKDFNEVYQLSWAQARAKIYGDIHANVYLASFMPFLSKHREENYVKDLIREGFSSFIDIHVSCFEEARTEEISFVGSLAYYFKDILIEELQKRNYKLGVIIKSPIKELVNYHLNYKDILAVLNQDLAANKSKRIG